MSGRERMRDPATGRFASADGKAATKPKPRKGKAGSRGSRRWTPRTEAIFFRELGTVCNVAAALRAAGLGSDRRDAYERRKTNAAFRAGWEAAIDQSYAMLELEMLGRARSGGDRAAPADAAEARLRDIPNGLALQLLKLHQARKARPPAPSAPGAGSGRIGLTGRALRTEILRRLSELNKRMGGEG